MRGKIPGKEMSDSLGIEVVITGHKEKAVNQAEVVISGTNSREPVFKEEWLRPWSFLCSEA